MSDQPTEEECPFQQWDHVELISVPNVIGPHVGDKGVVTIIDPPNRSIYFRDDSRGRHRYHTRWIHFKKIDPPTPV